MSRVKTENCILWLLGVVVTKSKELFVESCWAQPQAGIQVVMLVPATFHCKDESETTYVLLYVGERFIIVKAVTMQGRISKLKGGRELVMVG